MVRHRARICLYSFLTIRYIGAMKRELMVSSLLLLAVPFSALAEERTWTNSKGVAINAEFVSHDQEAGKVTISKGGKEFSLAVDSLSEADQQWLSDRLAKIEAEAEAEAEAKAAEAEKWKELAGSTKSYASEGEHAVPYHVYYPPGYTGDSPPAMIIMFSPSGNGKGMLKSVTAACSELGWVGVGCDVFKNGADSALMKTKFGELLPHIEATVVHDPVLLYMGGFSGGALRAYRYTAAFDRPWKGVLAYGGWLGGDSSLDCPKKMAVAVVNGTTDKAANSHNTAVLSILKKRDCAVKMFSFSGGHKMPNASVTLKAMKWIDENSGE